MSERFVMRISHAPMLVAAAALAAVLALPAAASATPRVVRAGASNTGNCAAAACGSLSYAFRQAKPGDVVRVAGGSYPAQSIPAVAGRAGARVTFKPAPGASVRFGALNVSGSHVAVRGIQTGDVEVEDAQDVLVVNGSGSGLWINNSRNVTIRGGSYGGKYDKTPVMVGAYPESHDITFDGVDFHDAIATKSDTHQECVMANNVQGLTFRNNLFRNCAYFGILISSCCGGQLPPRDVLIESNVFERTYQWNTQGAPCSMMIGGVAINNLTFRNNTFQTPLCFSDTRHVNTKFVGNLGAAGSCNDGVTYAYNVWTSHRCSGTDVQNAGVMSQFVNPAAHDWHLKAGASAIDKASPSDHPATDREGKTRSGAPDAGAYEYGTGGSPPPVTGTPGAGNKLITRVGLNRNTICHRRTPSCRVTTAWLKVRAATAGRIVVHVRRARSRRLAKTLRSPLRKQARTVKLDGRRLRPGPYRITVTVINGGARDRSRVLKLNVR
jgi:hypothetical protein